MTDNLVGDPSVTSNPNRNRGVLDNRLVTSFNDSSDKIIIGVLRNLIFALIAGAARLFNELCHCYAIKILIQNLNRRNHYDHIIPPLQQAIGPQNLPE